MDYPSLLIEALVFLAIAAVVSTLTRVVVARFSPRGFARSLAGTVAVSVIVALVATEVWANVSQRPRYALITLLICALVAAVATIGQSSRREHLAEFRP